MRKEWRETMGKAKACFLAAVLAATSLLAACGAEPRESSQGAPNGESPPTATETASPETDEEADREAAAAVVEQFGRQLRMVSLLAPEEDLKQSIRDHYGEYVTGELLEAWLNDPSAAPGRLVSSPWPDRIEIGEITAAPGDSCEVTGEIIEITGDEEIAAKIPVTLRLVRQDGKWRISEFAAGEPVEP